MYKYLDPKYMFPIICLTRYCKYCYIQKHLSEAGRVSFMLSGKPTSKRQWANIQKFARYS